MGAPPASRACTPAQMPAAANKPSPPLEGFLLVDKPSGMTSHDVVGRVRRWAGTRKVGHAGTLDPDATGVLLVGIGKATRLLGVLALHEKSYTATFVLGASTSTDDAAGAVLERAAVPALRGGVNDPQLVQALAGLTGQIEQIPPQVSAIKVAGKRAYARARAGEQVELAPRRVRIDHFSVVALRRRHTTYPVDAGVAPELAAHAPDATHAPDVEQNQSLAAQKSTVDRAPETVELDVEVSCSSGTYIRSLARDLAQALQTLGHVQTLRRTSIGAFSQAQAHPLDELENVAPQSRSRYLLPVEQVACAAMAHVQVSASAARTLAYGGLLPLAQLGQVVGPLAAAGAGQASAPRPTMVQSPPASTCGSTEPSRDDQDQAPIAVLNPAGALVALTRRQQDVLRPTAVLMAPEAAGGP